MITCLEHCFAVNVNTIRKATILIDYFALKGLPSSHQGTFRYMSKNQFTSNALKNT